jgi:hypothetical protein
MKAGDQSDSDIFTARPFASLDRIAMKARLDELANGSLPLTVVGR